MTLLQSRHRHRNMAAVIISIAAIVALFYAFTLGSSPCARADASCGVGDNEVFAGTVGIQSGTAFTHTLSGVPTADRTLTLQDSTDTVVGRATTDTLTNKTLTAPDINAGTVDAITSLTVDTDLAFIGPQSVTTSSGPLTLSPTTDVLIANAKALILGHTAQIVHTAVGANEFQMLGTGALDASQLVALWSADTNGPSFSFTKSGAAAIGTGGTVTPNGATLGKFTWYSDDGGDLNSWSAQITVVAPSVHAANDTPGDMIFLTTAETDSGGTERLRIDSTGLATFTRSIVVGSPTDGDKGVGTINATAVYDDGNILTDYTLDQWIDGVIDIAAYDAAVPARFIPEKRQWRDDGTYDVIAAAEFVVRNHEPARRFAANPDQSLDIDQLLAYVTAERNLPALAPLPDGQRRSVGETVQGLTETVEVLLVHILEQEARINALEAK